MGADWVARYSPHPRYIWPHERSSLPAGKGPSSRATAAQQAQREHSLGEGGGDGLEVAFVGADDQVVAAHGSFGEIRSHLAYMTIDLPPEERHELGVDDALAGRLRETVAALGPEAAGPLVPDAVLQRYAVTGSREAVVARIAALRALIRPELLLFDAGDYSAAYLENAAAVITQAGAVAGPLPASRWPART